MAPGAVALAASLLLLLGAAPLADATPTTTFSVDDVLGRNYTGTFDDEVYTVTAGWQAFMDGTNIGVSDNRTFTVDASGSVTYTETFPAPPWATDCWSSTLVLTCGPSDGIITSAQEWPECHYTLYATAEVCCPPASAAAADDGTVSTDLLAAALTLGAMVLVFFIFFLLFCRESNRGCCYCCCCCCCRGGGNSTCKRGRASGGGGGSGRAAEPDDAKRTVINVVGEEGTVAPPPPTGQDARITVSSSGGGFVVYTTGKGKAGAR